MWVEPRSLLTDALRSLIAQHKAELLEVLGPKLAELAGHVRVVANHRGYDPQELLDDLKLSERSVDYWIDAFKDWANAVPTIAIEPDRDDRITCSRCAELSGNNRCQAARDGRMQGTMRDYSPVPDVLLRCECFRPKNPEPKH